MVIFIASKALLRSFTL